jgi:hypothetical protein
VAREYTDSEASRGKEPKVMSKVPEEAKELRLMPKLTTGKSSKAARAAQRFSV